MYLHLIISVTIIIDHIQFIKESSVIVLAVQFHPQLLFGNVESWL